MALDYTPGLVELGAASPYVIQALLDERDKRIAELEAGLNCGPISGPVLIDQLRRRAEKAEHRIAELEGERDDIDSYIPDLFECYEDGEPDEDRPIPLVERAQAAAERIAELEAENERLRRERDEARELLKRAKPYLDGIGSVDSAPHMDSSARPGFPFDDDGRKRVVRRPASWWDELHEIKAALGGEVGDA